MNKQKSLIQLLFFLMIFSMTPLFSQEIDIDSLEEQEPVEQEFTVAETGLEPQFIDNVHIFLNSLIIFPLSVYEKGFGLGETITFQYKLPFKLNIGFETGYYGFKSEAETDGYSVVGGYSIIPVLAQASYDFKIVENIYVTPVLKLGFGYTSAALNGWLEDSTFSAMFEGGVRLKGVVSGSLIIQGNVTYTGLIEKSGIFSILSLGFGFGL